MPLDAPFRGQQQRAVRAAERVLFRPSQRAEQNMALARAGHPGQIVQVKVRPVVEVENGVLRPYHEVGRAGGGDPLACLVKLVEVEPERPPHDVRQVGLEEGDPRAVRRFKPVDAGQPVGDDPGQEGDRRTGGRADRPAGRSRGQGGAAVPEEQQQVGGQTVDHRDGESEGETAGDIGDLDEDGPVREGIRQEEERTAEDFEPDEQIIHGRPEHGKPQSDRHPRHPPACGPQQREHAAVVEQRLQGDDESEEHSVIEQRAPGHQNVEDDPGRRCCDARPRASAAVEDRPRHEGEPAKGSAGTGQGRGIERTSKQPRRGFDGDPAQLHGSSGNSVLWVHGWNSPRFSSWWRPSIR